MTAEIRKLEEALNRLLPEFRLEGRPSAELLSAADHWSQAVWAAAEESGSYPLDNMDLTQGLRLSKRPVFVCGVHRSGTTLMRDLLDGHPQISVLPSEGSFLTGLHTKIAPLPRAEKLSILGREWLRRLVNPTNQAPFWLLGRTTPEGSPYVLFARMLMAWWPVMESHFGTNGSLQPLMAVALAYASCSGRPGIRAEVQRWVEKTPTNEFYLDRLWDELPDAKVIHLVRDPIAVYASRKRLEEQSLGSFRTARRVLEDLARSLEIAAENSSRSGQREYLLVRYEELIEKPEEVTERLAMFLEIEPSPSLLCPTVANIPTYPNSSFHRKEEAGSILVVAQDSHYKSLTDWEHELVAAYVGDFAGTLGYPVKSLKPGRKRLLKMRLRLWRGL